MAHCQCTVRTWSIYGIHRRRIAKSQWTKKATRGLWRRPLEVVSRGSQADPIDLQETRVAIEWFGKLVLKIESNWDHWPTISVISGEAVFKKHPRVTSLSEALLKPASDAQRCRTALHQQKQIGMDARRKLSRLLSKSEFTLCEEITNDSWIHLTILLNLVCFDVHVLLIGVARVWSARWVTSVEYHGIGLSNLPVERSFGEVRTVRHLDWTRSALRLLEFLMWSHSPFIGVEPNPM